MAAEKKDHDTEPAATPRVEVRLVPIDNADQPVLANYTALSAAPGMVFLDFGFLEPAMLAALPRLAKSGAKLPEAVHGKLAVRVAMGFDALQNLKQQIDRLAEAAEAQRNTLIDGSAGRRT
jgi:hypothetical protein